MATQVPDTDPASLDTPNDLGDNGRQEVADAVNKLVADAFVLYTKTKNFHWHMTGPISAITILCSTSSRTTSSPPPTRWRSASASSASARFIA